MRDIVSYTELSTLAKCEKMWTLRYRDKVDEPTERPIYFRKGSMLHELCHAWWIGGDAQTRAEQRELGVPEDFNHAALQDDVQWLYERYTKRYGELRAAGALRVVETELKVVNPIPHSGVAAVTYVDQLVWVKGLKVGHRELNGLYAVERKSMADWQRLDTLEVDPQVGIVLWQLRQAGWPVQGVIYDAMRTYRWKPEKQSLTDIEAELVAQMVFEPGEPEYSSLPKKLLREVAKARQETTTTERPLADSFQLLVTDRTGAQVDVIVDDMKAAVRRRALLGAGEVPMRNLGQTCKSCSYRNECHADLIFPELMELRYENVG